MGDAMSESKTALPWRNDPKLRFHAKFPDDVETLFLFGAEGQAEQMWVRLDGVDVEIGGYTGKLLNTPISTSDLEAGSRVTVRVTPGVSQPVWVSPTMRANKTSWEMGCTSCGFDLHCTPAGELIAAQFKGLAAGAVVEVFTTRCPVCGETMTVQHR